MIRPKDSEKLTEPQCKPKEEWLLESGRTEKFQAWMDSLEPERKRRPHSSRTRPVFGNYATYRK